MEGVDLRNRVSRTRNALIVRLQVVEHLWCDLELKDPLGLAFWACLDGLVESTVRVDPQWLGISGKHVAQYLGEKDAQRKSQNM
jgi:hypothetical protein